MSLYKKSYLSLYIFIKSMQEKTMFVALLFFPLIITLLTNILFPFKFSSLLSFLFLTIIIPTFIMLNSYQEHKNTILYKNNERDNVFIIFCFITNIIGIILVMTFIFLYFFFIVYILQISFGYKIISEAWFFSNPTEVWCISWNYYEFSTAYFAFISMTVTTISMIIILDKFNVNSKAIYMIMFSYLIITFPFVILDASLDWNHSHHIISIGHSTPIVYITSFIFPHIWTTGWFNQVDSKSWTKILPDGSIKYSAAHEIKHILKLYDWNWNIRLFLPWAFLLSSLMLKVMVRAQRIFALNNIFKFPYLRDA